MLNVYKVFFYQDRQGREPTLEFIEELAKHEDKASRINVNKIYDYIDFLRQAGTRAGEPYIKHVEGEIWELRPIRNRILFAAWDGKSFIILHHFMKSTQKTPQIEIDRAKRCLSDYRERIKRHE